MSSFINPLSRLALCQSCTLNATGQSGVTLSLRQKHLRAVRGPHLCLRHPPHGATVSAGPRAASLQCFCSRGLFRAGLSVVFYKSRQFIEPRIEQFSRWSPRAMELFTGIGKRLPLSRAGAGMERLSVERRPSTSHPQVRDGSAASGAATTAQPAAVAISCGLPLGCAHSPPTCTRTSCVVHTLRGNRGSETFLSFFFVFFAILRPLDTPAVSCGSDFIALGGNRAAPDTRPPSHGRLRVWQEPCRQRQRPSGGTRRRTRCDLPHTRSDFLHPSTSLLSRVMILGSLP